jgi:hypothetical protein
MIRIADVVDDLVRKMPLLQTGLQHRLFNLTQLARFIRPHVQVRARKEMKESALVMALSRLQRRMSKTDLEPGRYRIKNITVHTGLATATYTKTRDTHRAVHSFVSQVEKRHGYITLSEGHTEITVIYQTAYEPLLAKTITQRPIFTHTNLASLSISFDEQYTKMPGFIYIILQQMILQHINIIEISSTYTELVLLIDDRETKVGFDTLYALFGSE